MHPSPQGTGWIEVITGCMFSGKTEELIRRLILARYAKQDVLILKPKLDTRYALDHVVSHSGMRIEAAAVETADDAWKKGRGFDVVGIDEVQFFGPDIVPVCESLANSGSRVS